jgi:AAA+ superfamily predicted ATPase
MNAQFCNMENIQDNENKILDAIARIYATAEDSKLAPKFFKKTEADFKTIEAYFNVSNIQALFLVFVFVHNHKRGRLDFDDIERYTKCEDLYWLKHIKSLEELKQNGLLVIYKTESRKANQFVHEFEINKLASNAIIKNEPLPKKLNEEKENILDVLESISKVIENSIDKEINYWDMMSEVKELYKNHKQFELIKNIDRLNLQSEDVILFYYITWKTLIGKKNIDIEDLSNAIHLTQSKSITYMHRIIEEVNPLIENKFLEAIPGKFGNDVMVKLAPAGEEFLKANGVLIAKLKVNNKEAIYPTDIMQKELIYSDDEKEQLELIKSTLCDKQLQKIQERLVQKSLPKGITILLHGAPGTGKTESVLQIAKATNRAILKIDLSRTKSMWFGESEKIVKQIFTKYKSFAEDCEQLPILLFNEADGLLSKRKEANSSSVSQTENTIQNILLDELENFDGILMATTNLIGNLDSAFDRRFLFKVKFVKPTVHARAKIWKSKLPALHECDCKLLAEQFDFSGGPIDNIVRKVEIDEVINGGDLCLKKVVQFCKEETVVDKKGLIGFGRG